jgi:hypothetical protein
MTWKRSPRKAAALGQDHECKAYNILELIGSIYCSELNIQLAIMMGALSDIEGNHFFV